MPFRSPREFYKTTGLGLIRPRLGNNVNHNYNTASVHLSWYPTGAGLNSRIGNLDIVSPVGIWGAYPYIWVINNGIKAYNIFTKTRHTQADIDATLLSNARNNDPIALYGEDQSSTLNGFAAIIYVIDKADRKVYAYDPVSKIRMQNLDFDLDNANTDPSGMWISLDNKIYISDKTGNKIYVYNGDTKAHEPTNDWSLTYAPNGIWGINDYVWVLGSEVQCYNFSDRTRNTDYDFTRLSNLGITSPVGLFGSEELMYTASGTKLFGISMINAEVGVNSYLVEWKNSESETYTNTRVIYANEITIPNIVPSLAYDVRLTAKAKTGGIDSNIVNTVLEFDLPEDINPPSQPTNANATTTSNRASITITWTDATASNLQYFIQWTNLADYSFVTNNATVDSGVQTFGITTGIVAGQGYSIRLFSQDKTTLRLSEPIELYAVAGDTPTPTVYTLLPPEGIQANHNTDINNPTITLTWEGVEEADSYQVRYKLSTSNSWFTPILSASDGNSHTQVGLTLGRTYDFQVRSIRPGSPDSAWSGTVTHKAVGLYLPKPVITVNQSAPFTAFVDWDDIPDAPADTMYLVEWRTGSNAYSQANSTHVAKSQYTVANLTNGTIIRFRVTAESQGFSSETSDEVSVTINAPAQVPVPQAFQRYTISSANHTTSNPATLRSRPTSFDTVGFIFTGNTSTATTTKATLVIDTNHVQPGRSMMFLNNSNIEILVTMKETFDSSGKVDDIGRTLLLRPETAEAGIVTASNAIEQVTLGSFNRIYSSTDTLPRGPNGSFYIRTTGNPIHKVELIVALYDAPGGTFTSYRIGDGIIPGAAGFRYTSLSQLPTATTVPTSERSIVELGTDNVCEFIVRGTGSSRTWKCIGGTSNQLAQYNATVGTNPYNNWRSTSLTRGDIKYFQSLLINVAAEDGDALKRVFISLLLATRPPSTASQLGSHPTNRLNIYTHPAFASASNFPTMWIRMNGTGSDSNVLQIRTSHADVRPFLRFYGTS